MTLNNGTTRYSALPTVVFALLAINGLCFLVQIYQPQIVVGLALWPAGVPEPYNFAPWQLVSYAFLHGGLGHLFVNLFALWMFGSPLENLWGSQRFTIYYFICVIGAGLTQLVVVTSSIETARDVYPTIGASGGVFGILLAYGMTWPNRTVMLLIPPIPMKAKWFVIIYGAVELFFGITGTQQGVAHFAHLGGMAFGFGVLYWWRRPQLPR